MSIPRTTPKLAPKAPRMPKKATFPNLKQKAKPVPLASGICSGGPFAGKRLSSRLTGNLETLIFTIREFTGRYQWKNHFFVWEQIDV